MTQHMRDAALPDDYAERVYAGVLGKLIGVYVGRPVEGWTYERISSTFGEIDRYVPDPMGAPLVVSDDDIAGTFTFLRAMSDNGNDAGLTSEQIGNAWLSCIFERRTIVWFGGIGDSTEHTAYLRLKSGIQAPASGCSTPPLASSRLTRPSRAPSGTCGSGTPANRTGAGRESGSARRMTGISTPATAMSCQTTP